ncbi:FLYWCH-type domain-containing protein [Aphis craccivora]|uniref:FLYWCH-type domain-containing protein n=1 Tax=Aphis craccivora TaxID=307492 RepID=A0A6G0Z521_APHCR|nr:FLYWCH-type domain-containing protein [Aphis craccivora]
MDKKATDKKDTVKCILRRQRSKNCPINSTIIEGNWCTTGEPNFKRFLLYDNGSNSNERITIFATDDSLKLLSEAEEWFMNGNFALSPTEFQQLYVIQIQLIQVKSIFITPVFCLLKRKTQSSYEKLIKILLEKCNEREIYLDPLIVHVDFEKAVIEALKNTIGNHICIKGCFYHLTQSTHRKIQSLGLENIYGNNSDFSIFCRKLDSLAFLPENKVLEGMDFLRTIMPPEATDLVDYLIPRMSMGLTEVFSIIQIMVSDFETLHHSIHHQYGMYIKLPLIMDIILITKQKGGTILSSDETKLAQFAIGNLSKKKKTYENMQEKLYKICGDGLTQRTIDEYLTAIAYTIRLDSERNYECTY